MAVGAFGTISVICLVPQDLLAIAARVFGVDEWAWFVALFLPRAWPYPARSGSLRCASLPRGGHGACSDPPNSDEAGATDVNDDTGRTRRPRSHGGGESHLVV